MYIYMYIYIHTYIWILLVLGFKVTVASPTNSDLRSCLNTDTSFAQTHIGLLTIKYHD